MTKVAITPLMLTYMYQHETHVSVHFFLCHSYEHASSSPSFDRSGFALPDNRTMLKEGLSAMACRLDNTELSQPTLLHLVQ